MKKQLDHHFLNITCQRNLTPLHGKQAVACIILGRKKSEIYVKMHTSLVFQGLERNKNRCMISEKEDGSLRKN